MSPRIFLKKREVHDSDKSMQTDETEVGDLVGLGPLSHDI